MAEHASRDAERPINPWSISDLFFRMVGPEEVSRAQGYPAERLFIHVGRGPRNTPSRPVRQRPARHYSPEELAVLRQFQGRRREMVYALRRGGASFVDIAQELHVTAQRARQLFCSEERRLRLQPLSPEMVAVLRAIVRQLEEFV